MNILNELFLSEKRQLVDKELRRITDEHVSNSQLRDNILYHLCLDEGINPTLEHSKRLRAYLCLTIAEENSYEINKIVPLAVVLELIHNATLIIDDIQDNGIARCGRLALWQKVGIPLAVNAAYFMSHISLAYYNLECKRNNFYDYSAIIIKIIADMGSAQQLDLEYHDEMTFDIYNKIAEGKTGSLLKLSLLFGLMPYDYNEKIYNMISEFSALFAVAYQIGDDISDLEKYKEQEIQNFDTSNIYFCFEKTLEKKMIEKVESEILQYQQKKQSKVYEMLEVLSNEGIIRNNNLLNLINEIWKR